MVGVVLKYKDYSENIIALLLRNVLSENDFIDMHYWESIDDNEFNEKCITNTLIESKKAFRYLLDESKIVNPVFLKMMICTGKYHKNIETYDDFLRSKYFISIVIIDTNLVEICCKREDTLLEIIKNFEASNLTEKQLIYIEKISKYATLDPWREKGTIDIMSMM